MTEEVTLLLIDPPEVAGTSKYLRNSEFLLLDINFFSNCFTRTLKCTVEGGLTLTNAFPQHSQSFSAQIYVRSVK